MSDAVLVEGEAEDATMWERNSGEGHGELERGQLISLPEVGDGCIQSSWRSHLAEHIARPSAGKAYSRVQAGSTEDSQAQRALYI